MMDARTHGPIGSVRAVRFDKDGKVINYAAERYCARQIVDDTPAAASRSRRGNRQ